MEMRVKKQVLSPTVKYSEKAALGAQMLGIGSDGGQGFGRGAEEENAVDEIFVLVSDGSNLFGNREDDMKIVRRGELRMFVFRPIPHERGTDISGNAGRGSYRNRAARDYSSRSARDDRRGLQCDTPRSRS